MKLVPGKLYRLKVSDQFSSLSRRFVLLEPGTILMYLYSKGEPHPYRNNPLHYFLAPDGAKIEGYYEETQLEQYLEKAKP